MLIDSYMHMGHPRFGRVDDVLAVMDHWGISKAVLVLQPFCVDVPELLRAQELAPDRLRLIGVPGWGDDDKCRREAALQLAAGVIGFRVQGDQPLSDGFMLQAVGERGGWLFATDPLKGTAHTECLLQWLSDHPAARVALPHFLSPDLSRLDNEPAEQLLRHERVHPIFSRQGQVGSSEQAPWSDLLPWCRRVLEICGWQRCLFGSEYPVLYWRGERWEQARDWVHAVGLEPSEAELAAFQGGTADGLFFQQPAPVPEVRVHDLPEDIRAAAAWEGDNRIALRLPTAVHQALLSAYVRRDGPDDPISLDAYCVEVLASALGVSGDD